MAARLIVGVLNVRSSFRSGREEPIAKGAAPDTVQWCVTEDGMAWRLRSYAFDRDLHALLCGIGGPVDATDDYEEQMREQYGNLLRSVHAVDLPKLDKKSSTQALRRAGLKASLDIAPSGFAFWNPDGQPYRTELAVL
jgi:hypothetical protein